ncbi:alpha/beta hydrolase [Rhodanobacter sp. C05]|uniref:alpha/beta hydrolase n=1 Tax=Rhodanobacter sp. C05 TaxID=1945855 RepID=UPI00117B6ECC|nr:alpha/beta hydrolase [Rhodanobacter sp. C05]
MSILPRLSACLALFILTGSLYAQQTVSVPRADGALTPLMVYDATSATCPPLLLISPGAGGDEKGMRYLGEAMSRDGWRTIVMGHRESGMASLRADVRQSGGIRRGVATMVSTPTDYRARLMDIDAALQWSQQRCRAPFKALLGHSMGARTVQIEAGALNKLGVHGEGGFDAYVALSPAGPDEVFPVAAERNIQLPMLMITGTRDSGMDGDYHWRMQAFDALSARCSWLAVIDGSTHMNFAGAGVAGKTRTATIALTTTWLDGLRAGHCGELPNLAGVSLTHK